MQAMAGSHAGPVGCGNETRPARIIKCAGPMVSSGDASEVALLFLFAAEGRLPSGGFRARRRGNGLDLLFFGFLGLAIAFLLAFGHVGLLQLMTPLWFAAEFHIDA
jgi:hypothetical protein